MIVIVIYLQVDVDIYLTKLLKASQKLHEVKLSTPRFG